MNPNILPSSTSVDPHHPQDTLDSLWVVHHLSRKCGRVVGLAGASETNNLLSSSDEFLSRFLYDFPDVSPTPIYTSSLASEQAPSSVPSPPSLSHHTCYWVAQDNPSFVCGEPIAPNRRDACMHYRLIHDIRGNDKATVVCLWHECRAPPMQRGSLIRHLLAVHLGLLRWQCEMCGKVFSRRGTGHVCVYDVGV